MYSASPEDASDCRPRNVEYINLSSRIASCSEMSEVVFVLNKTYSVIMNFKAITVAFLGPHRTKCFSFLFLDKTLVITKSCQVTFHKQTNVYY